MVMPAAARRVRGSEGEGVSRFSSSKEGRWDRLRRETLSDRLPSRETGSSSGGSSPDALSAREPVPLVSSSAIRLRPRGPSVPTTSLRT